MIMAAGGITVLSSQSVFKVLKTYTYKEEQIHQQQLNGGFQKQSFILNGTTTSMGISSTLGRVLQPLLSVSQLGAQLTDPQQCYRTGHRERISMHDLCCVIVADV